MNSILSHTDSNMHATPRFRLFSFYFEVFLHKKTIQIILRSGCEKAVKYLLFNQFSLTNVPRRVELVLACFGSLWIFCRLVLIVVDRLGRFGSFCLVSRFISNWPNKNTLWRVQFILCKVFGSVH